MSLVTKNIRDFGVRKLATLGIEVQRPDAFLLDLFGLDESGFAAAFAALRGTLRSNPTPEQLLERLAADGQTETAAACSRRGRQVPQPSSHVKQDVGWGEDIVAPRRPVATARAGPDLNDASLTAFCSRSCAKSMR